MPLGDALRDLRASQAKREVSPLERLRAFEARRLGREPSPVEAPGASGGLGSIALRAGLPMAGLVGGSLIGSPVAGFTMAGLLGALGERLADPEASRSQIALAGLLGALPTAKVPGVSTALGKTLLRAGTGLAEAELGLAATRAVEEGRLPTAGEAIAVAPIGLGLGALAGRIEARRGVGLEKEAGRAAFRQMLNWPRAAVERAAVSPNRPLADSAKLVLRDLDSERRKIFEIASKRVGRGESLTDIARDLRGQAATAATDEARDAMREIAAVLGTPAGRRLLAVRGVAGRQPLPAGIEVTEAARLRPGTVATAIGRRMTPRQRKIVEGADALQETANFMVSYRLIDPKRGAPAIREIVRLARAGNLVPKQASAILAQHGVSPQEFWRRLGTSLSRSEREALDLVRTKQLLGRIIPEGAPRAFQDAGPMGRVAEAYTRLRQNLRGTVVSSMMTTARNATDGGLRSVYSLMTDLGSGTLEFAAGQTKRLLGLTARPITARRAFADALETLRSTYMSLTPIGKTRIAAMVAESPRLGRGLYGTLSGDVLVGERTNRVVNFLNSGNRINEYWVRNLHFMARRDAIMRRMGLDPLKDRTPDRALSEGMDQALKMSWAKTPPAGTAWAKMVDFFSIPPFDQLVLFPRFLYNRASFLAEFNPARVTRLVDPRLWRRIGDASGEAASRDAARAMGEVATAGAIVSAAYALRTNPSLAGDKWYEMRVSPTESVDLRPSAALVVPLFMAHVYDRGPLNVTAGEWIEGAISMEREVGRLGSLQAAVRADKPERLSEWVTGFYADLGAGFLTPGVALKDLIAAAGDTRQAERLLGPETAAALRSEAELAHTKELSTFERAILQRVPFAARAEGLPMRPETLRPGAARREEPGLRQLTGLTFIKRRTPLAREIARLKLENEFLPQTGLATADRVTTEVMGALVDRAEGPEARLSRRIFSSEAWKWAEDDDQKREVLLEGVPGGSAEGVPGLRWFQSLAFKLAVRHRTGELVEAAIADLARHGTVGSLKQRIESLDRRGLPLLEALPYHPELARAIADRVREIRERR